MRTLWWLTSGMTLGATVEPTQWGGGRLTPEQWAQTKGITADEWEIAEECAADLLRGLPADPRVRDMVADWRRQITILELTCRILNARGYVLAQETETRRRGNWGVGWRRLEDAAKYLRTQPRMRYLPGGIVTEEEEGKDSGKVDPWDDDDGGGVTSTEAEGFEPPCASLRAAFRGRRSASRVFLKRPPASPSRRLSGDPRASVQTFLPVRSRVVGQGFGQGRPGRVRR